MNFKKLPTGDGYTIVVGNCRYKFWKGFPLVGEVTEIHYAKHN